MSDVITLSIWVRGQAIQYVFQIDIARTADVQALQRVIQESEKHAFHDTEAKYIRLYKPSVPVTKPYEAGLCNVLLSDCGEFLAPTAKLSALFESQPATNQIHIIVDPPYIGVDCWFLQGNQLGDSFSISAQTSGKIGLLKKSVLEEMRHLGSDSTAIRLFRVSRSAPELHDNYGEIQKGKFLPANHLLYKHFLDVPVLQPFEVIIVYEPQPHRSMTLHPSSAYGPNDFENNVCLARETYLVDRHRTHSPSGGSHPASFREAQKDEKTRIHCGRPREAEETIPAMLLHPVFGQFVDDCHAKKKVMTEQENDLVNRLEYAMSALYADEKQRVEEVTRIFKLAGLNFDIGQRLSGAKYVTDAVITISVENYNHPFAIAEFKNEAANSSSEPYMQAALYYLEATRPHAPRMSASPLPCFLLILFGPYLVFAGATWNLRPNVQLLSTPLAFQYHTTDAVNQRNAARHMAALRKAIASLKKHYEEFDVSMISKAVQHDMLFPHCTTFRSLDDKSKQSFCYQGQPDKKRLVFFGELTADRAPICIKFVQRYSRDAHLHCAKVGFAPKLRGFREIPGGWYMVVMDRLVGYEPLADFPKTGHLPISLYESIGKQLKTLHERKMVHGDIRDTNILVKKDERAKFMIVDFDWAGRMGRVRYPPLVNHTDIWRPEDARDGLRIREEHDDAMLRNIFGERGK